MKLFSLNPANLKRVLVSDSNINKVFNESRKVFNFFFIKIKVRISILSNIMLFFNLSLLLKFYKGLESLEQNQIFKPQYF